MQWVSRDHGTATYKSCSDEYDPNGRILSQWSRPAPHAPGWTDALSVFVPGVDVTNIPGDPETGDGTQWVENPGKERVVEFRLIPAKPTDYALNLASLLEDEQARLGFINGFRLHGGETLLIISVDSAHTGARRSRVDRLRARERRTSPAEFDLLPAGGAKAAVIDVAEDGYRSIWDLSLTKP